MLQHKKALSLVTVSLRVFDKLFRSSMVFTQIHVDSFETAVFSFSICVSNTWFHTRVLLKIGRNNQTFTRANQNNESSGPLRIVRFEVTTFTNVYQNSSTRKWLLNMYSFIPAWFYGVFGFHLIVLCDDSRRFLWHVLTLTIILTTCIHCRDCLNVIRNEC